MYSTPWNDPYRQYYNNAFFPPPYPQGQPPLGYAPEPRGWWRSIQNLIANRLTRPAGRSSKYPQLLFLLAADTTRLQWDVRRPPSSIDPSIFVSYRQIYAMETRAEKLRIISKEFPWTIDIEAQVPISCEMVWQALYQGLQQPIADSEWGMICSMKKASREIVEKAAKKRRDVNPQDVHHLKRIDYLGDKTMFAGLGKDEEFAKLRLFPGTKGHDTWVVSFKT